jgi:hypothetical protein
VRPQSRIPRAKQRGAQLSVVAVRMTETLRKIPINYVVRDGNVLILNTRTAAALEPAAVMTRSWR